MTIVVFTNTACNSNAIWLEQGKKSSTVVQTIPSSPKQTPIATKVVKDSLGQVEIPRHPQRVIVLDCSFYLNSILTLGVKPVGFTPCQMCLGDDAVVPSELVADIPQVGIHPQPSIEKILSLKPDLILTHKSVKQSYPQFSAIAPTLGIAYHDVLDFKELLKYLAQVVGKSDRAEEILTEYKNRIQSLRQRLETKLGGKTVATIELYTSTSNFGVYRPGAYTHGQVMSDAGLQFIQAQKVQKTDFVSRSIETLSEYDADFMFIFINNESGSKNLEPPSFLTQPIWSTMKAVRNQQVYIVNWACAEGALGANRVVDDLEKYLVKAA